MEPNRGTATGFRRGRERWREREREREKERERANEIAMSNRAREIGRARWRDISERVIEKYR